MALTKFQKPAQVKGDHLPTKEHLDTPFYIAPLEIIEGMKTKHDPEGVDPKLRAHAYDLANDVAYANIILFNGVLVENLARYVGDETVIRFADVLNKARTATYRGVLEGTDADFALAEKKMDDITAAIESRVAELAAEAEAEAKAATPAPAPAGRGAFKR